MNDWILLIIIVALFVQLWWGIKNRLIGGRFKKINADLEEIKDGILEIEARVRRLEHNLLSRKQTEEQDPSKFVDKNTGKPMLSDKIIEATKRIIKDVRWREIHRRVDPAGAEQIEKLEALQDKMYSSESIDEDEIRDAFRK